MAPPVDAAVRPDRPLGWVRGYSWSALRPDVLAGLTVTAIAVPESLGYARIVGLPPETGLYCALFPAVAFALVASSRQLVVGADSATASLVAAGAAAVVAPGAAGYPGTVALLCVVAAVVLVAMAAARLGFLADLVGRPVLTGFLSGVGVHLVLTKLPAVLGLEVTGGAVDQLVGAVRGLGSANWWAAGLAALTVGVYLAVERFVPRLPGALVALVVAAAAAQLVDAAEHGVAAVGAVPAGLPSWQLPDLSLGDAARLGPAAAGVALVVLAQSAAVARSFAATHDRRVDPNVDLLALGAANAVSALSSGFAVNGSPPRTAASDAAGGRTPVVNLVMALCVAVLLVWCTGLFDLLPSVVLDALVLGIGLRLVAVGELRRIYRARRAEAAVAVLALVVVALVGVEQGLGVAVVVALADRLRRQYHPHDEVLVLDGEADVALERRAGHHLDGLDGVVAYRFGSSLFFENSDYFDQRVRALVARCDGPPRAVVVDARAVEDVDWTAGAMLDRLHRDLRAQQCDLIVAEASPELREALARVGLGGLQCTDDVVETVMALRSV